MLLCADEAPRTTIRARIPMKSLEETLVHVWSQALAENAKSVEIEGQNYAVKSTPRRGLKQVDFRFDGKNLRGLEQNPDTKSRWASMARSGKKVMQFLEAGRYLAVVVDGKTHLCDSCCSNIKVLNLSYCLRVSKPRSWRRRCVSTSPIVDFPEYLKGCVRVSPSKYCAYLSVLLVTEMLDIGRRHFGGRM